MLRRPMSAGGELSIAISSEARSTHASPDHEAPAVSEPEPRLADVPLVVEDLLLQSRQLVDSGAPNEVIEEVLEHVSGLREGRC